MIRDFEEVRGGLRRKVDAVIVGAGAAGAAAALGLAEKGLSVAVVEKGRRFHPHEFVAKFTVATRRMYAEGGMRAMVGNVVIPLPGGEGLGGSTLINSAIAFKPPAPALARWRRESGVEWLHEDVLGRHVDRVWETVGVTRMHPLQVGLNSVTVKRGARRLGIQGELMDRSAPGCVGCGVCHLGCPSGGKGSTDLNFVPLAERAGAEFITCCRVERIVIRNNRAVGIEARAVDPETREPAGRVIIEADRVLLAGSTIGTALLLLSQRLGNSSGQVGENLHVHPATGGIARYPHEILGWKGAPQGFWAADESAPEAVLESAFYGPEAFFTLLPTIGRREIGRVKEARYFGMAGIMIRDVSSGTVRPTDDGRADIHYDLVDVDRLNLIRGLRLSLRVMLAAGAIEIFPQVRGVAAIESEEDILRRLPDDVAVDRLGLYASHPMGTCRIGTDPKRSVVRPDGRLHDVESLYVVDGSLFPSALGWNPSITIMAMALHLAEGIARA